MKISLQFIVLSVLLGFAACKKQNDDMLPVNNNVDTELRFFKTSGNIKPAVLKIKIALQTANSKNPFISEFIKLAGFPRWDKGVFVKNTTGVTKKLQSRVENLDSNFVIPVVNENNSLVTGAIIATVGDSSSYRLVVLNDYEMYNANKKEFLLAMMALDAKVYDYNKFKIVDTSAMDNIKEIYLSNSDEPIQSSTINAAIQNDDPCDIIEWWANPDGDACHCSGDEYYTGEWQYVDADNCNAVTPQPLLSFFLTETIGGYYTLPDLGNGSSNGGGLNNPPYTPVPFTAQQKSDYLIDQLNLDATQQFYLENTEGATNSIFNFLYSNNTNENRNLSIWVLNYIYQNQDVDISTLENWFFSKAEYTNGEDEIEENEITYEIPITLEPLPSLSDFTIYFPKYGFSGQYTQMKSTEVYQLVGGSIYSNHLSGNSNYQNACAIRASKALIHAGISIPVLKYNSSQRTEKGGDNNNYILDAVSFHKFMIDKFGNTTHELTGANANDPQKVADLLKNKNGIYVIINNDGTISGAGYSGHVDLIINGNCIGGAYTNPNGGVKSISVWELN